MYKRQGPCYRCLFPEPPEPGQIPSCAEGGVLGVLPGVIGCLQANEAIKLILGIGDPIIGRLLHFDALSFRFREIKLRRDLECAVCGEEPTIQELKEIVFNCEMREHPLREIDVHQLKARLENNRSLVLLDVREPAEVEVGKIKQSIVIPLGELPDRVGELDPGAETIIHCKAGSRSAKALAILNKSGFVDACHVRGGIAAWAEEIDPSIEIL